MSCSQLPVCVLQTAFTEQATEICSIFDEENPEGKPFRTRCEQEHSQQFDAALISTVLDLNKHKQT